MQKISHPLLLAAFLVLLGDYVVDAREDGPRDTSDRVRDALARSCLQLGACLSAVLKDLQHVEPFRAALTFDLRILHWSQVSHRDLDPSQCLLDSILINCQVICLDNVLRLLLLL